MAVTGLSGSIAQERRLISGVQSPTRVDGKEGQLIYTPYGISVWLRGIAMVMDDDGLQFCWDDSKAAANIEKHGVSFELATHVFDDPMRLERADAFAEGEYRSIVIARVNDKLLSVVYTAPADGLYRIISARFATSSERDDY